MKCRKKFGMKYQSDEMSSNRSLTDETSDDLRITAGALMRMHEKDEDGELRLRMMMAN